MTNLEYYKDEFVCMLKKSKLTLCSCFEALNNHDDCDTCPYNVENCAEEGLCNYRKFIDWLLEEHKEPIKLKKWEYDLLTLIDKERTFFSISKLRKLREKGHFKGVTDTLMDMEEILEDFVIVSDDYEGFDDCK